MRSGRPILGAEQIFDVELDRKAQPLPADLSSDSLSNSVLWAEDRGTSDKIEQQAESAGREALAVEPVAQAKSEAKAELVLPSEEEVASSEDRVEPRMCFFRSPWDGLLIFSIAHGRLMPILSKLRLRYPLTLEGKFSRLSRHLRNN